LHRCDCQSGVMASGTESAVFVDMDSVLLSARQGRRGVEINVQADIDEGLGRLAQTADLIYVLAFPVRGHGTRPPSTENRIETLREGLNGSFRRLRIVTCPHSGDDMTCDCAKPGTGLIQIAQADRRSRIQSSWFIGADQEGVQSGRGAGLRTVRIGPAGSDHMSSVHKPDYEARDLLDAANHILMEELN
jgi:histidinol phosphatase-like enzyme